MAKKISLNGSELASFIKVRQAKQVRRLKQADRVSPRLAILMTDQGNPVIDTYVRLKQAYGRDIGIEVVVARCKDQDMTEYIQKLNNDDRVHAVVVQLPLAERPLTDQVVTSIASHKDVDGLGSETVFISATAEAIDWLLAGYGVDLTGKKIVLIGRGKLVGAPLERLWSRRGLDVTSLDQSSIDIASECRAADVIVSATGQAGILKSAMVKPGAVVIDAGTASEDGKIVGDAEASLRQRSDISITPEKGGVGPLTVAMMFDHVIRAANNLVESGNVNQTNS